MFIALVIFVSCLVAIFGVYYLNMNESFHVKIPQKYNHITKKDYAIFGFYYVFSFGFDLYCYIQGGYDELNINFPLVLIVYGLTLFFQIIIEYAVFNFRLSKDKAFCEKSLT